MSWGAERKIMFAIVVFALSFLFFIFTGIIYENWSANNFCDDNFPGSNPDRAINDLFVCCGYSVGDGMVVGDIEDYRVCKVFRRID